MSTPARRVPLAFGAFEVDPDSGQIRKHGLRVRLDDKAFRVLLALVEHPGEVVTREELTRRLWPDNVFVEFDKNLNNAVGRLRDVLGDSAASPRFIETLPRKGYRFIGSVDVAGSAPRPEAIAPPRRRPPVGAFAALAAAVAAAGIYVVSTVPVSPLRSIVVLPFDSAGVPTDQATAHLAFGITDALTAELSRLEGLRVVSVTSARWYKDAGKPLAQIARELQADAVIEGSVFQEGAQLRVTVQLIDAATDSHLWAETYNRERGSLIALQMEIAEAVAREVDLTLTPAEQQRLATRPAIDPASAWQPPNKAPPPPIARLTSWPSRRTASAGLATAMPPGRSCASWKAWRVTSTSRSTSWRLRRSASVALMTRWSGCGGATRTGTRIWSS